LNIEEFSSIAGGLTGDEFLAQTAELIKKMRDGFQGLNVDLKKWVEENSAS